MSGFRVASIEQTLAKHGAQRLWRLLHDRPYVNTLGALTGNQAMQQIRAGLDAIYLSGWQVADANVAGSMYPDRSIRRTAARSWCAGSTRCSAPTRSRPWKASKRSRTFTPRSADCEAGFGGVLNAFELAKAYIEAGAAGIHFEDQLASEKKCGHMGGKVLIPTQQHIGNLNAARLAADVMGTSTLVICRTDAESAKLITSDFDERDRPFMTGERTTEGFYRLKEDSGFDHCVARGLSFAPYSDLLWMETSTPNLEQARRFAEPSARSSRTRCGLQLLSVVQLGGQLDKDDIARFQREIGAMGYKFQFVTLAGFHSLNHGMFELARGYKERGGAYSELRRRVRLRVNGYSATATSARSAPATSTPCRSR